MDSAMMFGEDLFPTDQPWDVVFDSLWVSHSEFWLVAAGGHGADIVSAVPDGDSVRGSEDAVGVPTLTSAAHIGVVLSVWEGPAPDGAGALLGTSRIEAPDREVTLVNVEGREPGPVLVLSDGGEHEVRVWRRSEGPERYDIRIWPCATRLKRGTGEGSASRASRWNGASS
ncbi:hypothetical protein ACFC0D_03590 [Streptomyces sp. NPDC056222]|uniref:hypothetical protein n=1 Tax=Streptomyces sp. NPDC056222 TaxID=3345749 RepID=UPI0035DEDBE2